MSFPGVRAGRAASRGGGGNYSPRSQPGLQPQLPGASKVLCLALTTTNYDLREASMGMCDKGSGFLNFSVFSPK